MATTTMTLKAWGEAVHGPRGRLDFNGYSPGGAAEALGITRQAVHQAVHRGTLDCLRLTDPNGHLLAVIIPHSSLEHYRKHYARKAS